MTVSVQPMPNWMRTVPKRLWPTTTPVFPDCGPDGPTSAEVTLARELFNLLDADSQDWYRHCNIFKGL